jgi:hypothetical protein
MAGPVGRFSLFISKTTKAVPRTCSSLIKTPALFQERSLMEAAPLPEQLTPG